MGEDHFGPSMLESSLWDPRKGFLTSGVLGFWVLTHCMITVSISFSVFDFPLYIYLYIVPM